MEKIKFSHYEGEMEYVFIENIDTSACLREWEKLIPAMADPKQTGGARDPTGAFIKNNKGVFLDKCYSYEARMVSPSVELIECDIFATLKSMPKPLSSYFRYLNTQVQISILLSAYRNKDYYLPHMDSAKITVLVWHELGPYTGGELVFPEFNKTFKAKSGTGIAFPSHYVHEVPEVSSDEDGLVRVCLSGFWA